MNAVPIRATPLTTIPRTVTCGPPRLYYHPEIVPLDPERSWRLVPPTVERCTPLPQSQTPAQLAHDCAQHCQIFESACSRQAPLRAIRPSPPLLPWKLLVPPSAATAPLCGDALGSVYRLRSGHSSLSCSTQPTPQHWPQMVWPSLTPLPPHRLHSRAVVGLTGAMSASSAYKRDA